MSALIVIDRERLLALVRDGWTNEQLAAAFGCTVRTLDRHRTSDPELNRAILDARRRIAEANAAGHGTHARYRRGCRCRPCTTANTVRCRESLMRRRHQPAVTRISRARRINKPTVEIPTEINKPTVERLIEQAIARGESTSQIMRRHGCTYDTVQAVRHDMAEPSAGHNALHEAARATP